MKEEKTPGVIILYHSGSGSTRTISEVLQLKLSYFCETVISEIDLNYDYTVLDDYELLIFGFPILGGDVSRSMWEFTENMPPLDNTKKGFIFNTHALFEENAPRRFALLLKKKNVLITDIWII